MFTKLGKACVKNYWSKCEHIESNKLFIYCVFLCRREHWKRKEEVSESMDITNEPSDISSQISTRIEESRTNSPSRLSVSSSRRTRRRLPHFLGHSWSTLMLIVLLSFPIDYSEALGNVVGK